MMETILGSRWRDMEARVTRLQVAIKRKSSAINLLHLLDALDNLVLDLDFPSLHRNRSIEKLLKTYKDFKSDLGEVQRKTEPFEKIKLIGKGTFGEVHLVRHRISQKVFAMKSLSKSTARRSFWLERDIMAFTQSPWLVQLCCSFQDANYLYMVMNYMPGGDLSYLMSKGCMLEQVAKFYIAEVVLALEALHSMCYIHCDVKPQNVLLDQNGHVKLADFGVSIETDCVGMAYSLVAGGTLLYMAPEVLKLGKYGSWLERDCDWWSVGVLLYEMLIGHTPFASHSLSMVLKKIKNYKDYLVFPKNKQISEEARDIICGFLTDSMDRLGSANEEDIKQHPFFRNDHWKFDTILQTAAPILPELNFHCCSDGTGDSFDTKSPSKDKPFRGNQLHFLGFTYFNEKMLFEFAENQRTEAVKSTKKKSKKNDGITKMNVCPWSKVDEKLFQRQKKMSDVEKYLGCFPEGIMKVYVKGTDMSTGAWETFVKATDTRNPNTVFHFNINGWVKCREPQKQNKKVHFKRILSTQGMNDSVDSSHYVSLSQIKKGKKERKFGFFSNLWGKINCHKK